MMIVFFSVKEATKNAVILNQKIFLTKQNKKRLWMSCKNTGKVLQASRWNKGTIRNSRPASQ